MTDDSFPEEFLPKDQLPEHYFELEHVSPELKDALQVLLNEALTAVSTGNYKLLRHLVDKAEKLSRTVPGKNEVWQAHQIYSFSLSLSAALAYLGGLDNKALDRCRFSLELSKKFGCSGHLRHHQIKWLFYIGESKLKSGELKSAKQLCSQSVLLWGDLDRFSSMGSALKYAERYCDFFNDKTCKHLHAFSTILRKRLSNERRYQPWNKAIVLARVLIEKGFSRESRTLMQSVEKSVVKALECDDAHELRPLMTVTCTMKENGFKRECGTLLAKLLSRLEYMSSKASGGSLELLQEMIQEQRNLLEIPVKKAD